MRITADQLTRIAPNCGKNAAVYASCLGAAMDRFSIDTAMQAAHFLSQAAVESGDFTCFRENMNYGAAALMRTWPSRFRSLIEAQLYERQPAKLANFVYANRMGNGDEKSGDGWTYRGAGWLQQTGKGMQEECAAYFQIPLAKLADWLCTPNGAALSAAWVWWKKGCNRYADMNNVDAVSDLINLGHLTQKIGDSIGYDKRLRTTNVAVKVLS